jgi:transposase-like protein
VIDGAKALDRAVRKMSGTDALIRRCTIHKRRNVTDQLPETQAGSHRRQARPRFRQPRSRRWAACRP